MRREFENIDIRSENRGQTLAASRRYSKLWDGLDKLTGRASVGSEGGAL